jgi:hypothetical protein
MPMKTMVKGRICEREREREVSMCVCVCVRVHARAAASDEKAGKENRQEEHTAQARKPNKQQKQKKSNLCVFTLQETRQQEAEHKMQEQLANT